MFSEVLKIVPKIETKDLNKMQKNLQGRFKKLTKNFGRGLVQVLKGGGIAGIAIGLIDKLLNPLKEVQEAIDKTLATSDDLATNAAQFNTSSGKLFKLVSLGKASGMSQEDLYMLMSKFQAAVATAKVDPKSTLGKPVAAFVNEKDTAQAFFNFLQGLQNMDAQDRTVVQKTIFGDRGVLKMAEIIQKDFSKIFDRIGLGNVSGSSLTGSISKLGSLSDRRDELQTAREVKDLRDKAALINSDMINKMDESERIRLQRENQNISGYESLVGISQTMDKMMGVVEKGVVQIGSLVNKGMPILDRMTNTLEEISKSPMSRAIKGLFSKDYD